MRKPTTQTITAGTMDLPKIRPDACDPAVRRVVVESDDLGLIAATPPGSGAHHRRPKWS